MTGDTVVGINIVAGAVAFFVGYGVARVWSHRSLAILAGAVASCAVLAVGILSGVGVSGDFAGWWALLSIFGALHSIGQSE
jgi:hypothetical protein